MVFKTVENHTSPEMLTLLIHLVNVDNENCRGIEKIWCNMNNIYNYSLSNKKLLHLLLKVEIEMSDILTERDNSLNSLAMLIKNEKVLALDLAKGFTISFLRLVLWLCKEL